VHPHVIAVHDDAPDGGMPGHGADLLEANRWRRAERQGGAAPGDRPGILMQIAIALEAVHQGGIIHRDLKPDNVFWRRTAGWREEHIHVKVLDFGLARFTAFDPSVHAITQTGSMLGTPI